MAVINNDESAAVFFWKCYSLKEYWYCIINALIQLQGNGKFHIPDLIVDDWVDMTLLIHEVKKAEYLLLKDCAIPDPRSIDNADFNIVQTIIKHQLEVGDPDKWGKIVNMCMGFSEETSRVVHHMFAKEKTGNNHQN